MDGAATATRRLLPRDSIRDVIKKHGNNNKENASHRSSNYRIQKDRQTEWAKPGRAFNKNINRGYSRSPLPGVNQAFRIVKDNRTKEMADCEIVPGSFHNGDCSKEYTVPNIGDKSSTEKLGTPRQLVTRKSNGHGTSQDGSGHTISVQPHDKELKTSSDRQMEQSDGMGTTLVGSHSVSKKGIQNKVLTPPSGTNSFSHDLCCSSSDPIHVPPPGSRPVGTFGAIKRGVRVVGAAQGHSDSSAEDTSTSNSLATVTTVGKSNASSEQQSRLSGVSSATTHSNPSVSLTSKKFPASQHQSKSSIYVGHSKVNQHLEWKPKSISLSSVNPAVNVRPSSATSSIDGNQVGVACLSMKLSQAHVDKRVIIPQHLRVHDSERTHLIFGTFESEVKSKAFTSTPDVTRSEGLNDHSSTSMTAINPDRSTEDVLSNDQMDLVGSFATLTQSDSADSVSEHQQSLIVDMEVPDAGVIGEYRTNDMVSTNVTHPLPPSKHQDNSAVQNLKAYEPDSRYKMPFIVKAGDVETVKTTLYPTEIKSLHLSNDQLPMSSTSQQVPQMYQQVQAPQYPNCLPYRHVVSPYYVPPGAVPNYRSNPAFPQLPHASSYMVMPIGTSHIAANGMKYGPPHQYKQVFPGSPAGYGGYANQNGYPVNNDIMGSTVTVEDACMSKYDDNNIYTPNQLAETADVWIQVLGDNPNMLSSPFYNMIGQPMSPHTAAYLPAHNGHAPFSSAPQPPHLQYPGLPQLVQPTSMTMLQSPQAMVHQPAGAQLGAFQQNQLAHPSWPPQNY